MYRLGNAWVQAVVAAAFTYAAIAGATFQGVLLPGFRFASLALLVLLGVGWLALRRRRRWTWHATPLDQAIFLWLLVIGLSWLFNSGESRRIAIGVWFVGLYVLAWYVAYDLLANRALRREQLVNAVLVAGVVVVGFGYFQARGWLSVQLPLMANGTIGLDLPRLSSVFENPNSFGDFLVVMLPLAVGAWLARGFFARVALTVLIAAGLFLLALTYSRAAWIAAVAAFAIQGVLLLSARGLLDPGRFRRWWAARSRLVQAELSTTALLGALLLMFMFFLIFLSLRESGRSAGLRTGIFGAAVTTFSRHPVVGSGLFTFGQQLAQLQSMPPETPHSHAHSVPLQVAAELGLAGLVALLLSGIAVVRRMTDHWRAAGDRDRLLLTGVYGAIGGFAAHHLLDLPAMMPALALTGLASLLVALFAPGSPPAWPRRARFVYGLLTLLWLGLIVTSAWVTIPYAGYVQALHDGFAEGRYVEAARAMQPAIDADPTMPVYRYEQGFLFGLAADAGDRQALGAAIDAFSTYVALEPAFAPAWANLAALYAQTGDYAGAAENMAEAVERAPDAWQLRYRLATYEEAAGQTDAASAEYEALVRLAPELTLLPGWNESALRRQVGAGTRLSALGRVVLALDAGDRGTARALWDTIRPDYRGRALGYAVDAWLAVLEDDDESADTALAAAHAVFNTPQEEAWVWLVEARQAQAREDDIVTRDALERARALVASEEAQPDYLTGENWHNMQFLRLAAPRQFLPQVGYYTVSPLLLYLLERPSAG